MEDANSNSPTTAKRAITFQDVYPHGVQLSPDVVQVMEVKSKNREAITFDEVTLEDKPSDFHPNDVRLESWITRKVSLKGCGIMSAAMDTVTERELALEMAKIGGIGILHRNLDAETQAHMVRWVRRKIHYGGMIDKPICFNPSDKYSHLQKMIKVNGWTFTSFPIVDENGKLLGMMTRDEMDFVDSGNPELQQIMKKREAVITAPEGTDTETAYQIMKRQRVKKLPVVDLDDRIIGMYVWNDIKQDHRKRDTFSLDEGGNFLVGAAIGLGIEDMARVELLVHHGCKILVMDSSHGACKPAREQIRRIRERYGDSVEIIVGNIASYDSAMYLLDSQWRPDALKVGIGPGSICTTRSVTGHGIPQLTAIYQVWKAIRDYGAKHDKRSTLRNSLFTTEKKSHSLSSLPCANTLGINDEEKDTPTSENAETNHDSARSLNNVHREKYRKTSKGSLFHRPAIPSIGSIDKGLNEIDDESFRKQLSITSIGLTPTHSGREENPQEGNPFIDYCKKAFKGEESKNEDSLVVEESVSPFRKSRFGPMIPVPESLDNIDSPSKDSDHRSGIFQRDVESEIEEIKKDLDVENDPHIHFIRGNFYSFYYEGDVLGEGTTGLVKKCTRKESNEEFAVKVVHYRDDLEILILIVKEFKNHRKLNHKNIIKVYDLYIDYFKKKIYTVMELAECREMFDVVKDLGHYSEAVASGIFKQILTGINYLHHHGVCHRDLKPNNILVSEDGKIVKITDFNVSKFIDNNNKKKFSYLSTENYKMWTYTGTIAFTAPEVFLENEYTEAVDMWSAGAVLYTMLCGYQPFQATYVYELIELIKTGKYEFPADPWDNISKQAKSLVKHCLDINSRTRYSPSDALMHPWIANCGKVPNINIPRTVYYFNRYQRRNTGAKKTKHHNAIQKSSKNNQLRHHPKKWRAGDFGFTQAYDLFTQMNNAGGNQQQQQQEGVPAAEATPVNKLQPKRGKTGPQIPEHFLPGFLKLEKSFSCTVLEDPIDGGEEKCNEDYEEDEADMSEGDQDIYRFFENDDEILDHCPKQQADKERKSRKKKLTLKGADNGLKVMNREEEHEHLVDKSEVEIIKGRDVTDDKENVNMKVSIEGLST